MTKRLKLQSNQTIIWNLFENVGSSSCNQVVHAKNNFVETLTRVIQSIWDLHSAAHTTIDNNDSQDKGQQI